MKLSLFFRGGALKFYLTEKKGKEELQIIANIDRSQW